MFLRELLLVVVLLISGFLVVSGVYMIYRPAGFILGGIFLGAIGMFTLYDDGRTR